jgi:imidazoleglycerol phosphate dehydratase HisB
MNKTMIKRKSEIQRKTNETEIIVKLNIDGSGNSKINTGIAFFDHMLNLTAKFAMIDLELNCKGDLIVDDHHSIEDVGIVLGMAIVKALGDKKGIKRFGQRLLPMDESLCLCAIDISNRPYYFQECKFEREFLGDLSTECIYDFFNAFAMEARLNLQFIMIRSKNDHHKAEAMFKSFGKALKEACEINMRNKDDLPTTKGLL